MVQPAGEPHHPAPEYRKPRPGCIPFPEDGSRPLWELRGRPPPATKPNTSRRKAHLCHPSVTTKRPDVAAPLAEPEGWHDCAARQPEVWGTLDLDYLIPEDRYERRLRSTGQDPAAAAATRHNTVQQAKAGGAAKATSVKARQANVPPELKGLAVKRVVSDEIVPLSHTIRLTRQQISDKFPKPGFRIDSQRISQDDRTLATRSPT